MNVNLTLHIQRIIYSLIDSIIHIWQGHQTSLYFNKGLRLVCKAMRHLSKLQGCACLQTSGSNFEVGFLLNFFFHLSRLTCLLNACLPNANSKKIVIWLQLHGIGYNQLAHRISQERLLATMELGLDCLV